MFSLHLQEKRFRRFLHWELFPLCNLAVRERERERGRDRERQIERDRESAILIERVRSGECEREGESGCVPSTTTVVFRIPSLTTTRYIALRGSKPPLHTFTLAHLRKHNACFACRNSPAAFLGASLSPGCPAGILLGWYRSHAAYTGGTKGSRYLSWTLSFALTDVRHLQSIDTSSNGPFASIDP